MRAFFSECLDTAIRETRNVHLPEPLEDLPAGSYVFHEYFCDDLTCDCRRVIIRIHSAADQGMKTPLATISYGWESPGFYARWTKDPASNGKELCGASLDPINPQSSHSDALLALFEQVLSNDPALITRFQRHYLEFRNSVRRHQSPSGKPKPANWYRRLRL